MSEEEVTREDWVRLQATPASGPQDLSEMDAAYEQWWFAQDFGEGVEPRRMKRRQAISYRAFEAGWLAREAAVPTEGDTNG